MARGKKKSLHGAKIQAGKILSGFITVIASEKTEMVTVDGADDIVTKAEALARLTWKSALGFKEKVLNGVVYEDIIHPPSLAHQQIVWERMEGKAAPASEPIKPKKKDDATSRVSNELAKRINAISNLVKNDK